MDPRRAIGAPRLPVDDLDLRCELDNDVLVKRMTWAPHSDAEGGYYTFTAECSLGRLVTGTLQHAKRWWPQRDSTELAQLKCAISLCADQARLPWPLTAPLAAESDGGSGGWI